MCRGNAAEDHEAAHPQTGPGQRSAGTCVRKGAPRGRHTPGEIAGFLHFLQEERRISAAPTIAPNLHVQVSERDVVVEHEPAGRNDLAGDFEDVLAHRFDGVLEDTVAVPSQPNHRVSNGVGRDRVILEEHRVGADLTPELVQQRGQ